MSETTDAGAIPDEPGLIEAAARVADEVNALRVALAVEESQRKQAVERERQDRRRKQRLTWAILGFDVVASVVGLSLYWGQRQANHRIEQSLRQNYVTAQQQTETRTRVLCPTETALLLLLSLPRPANAPTLSAAQQNALTSAIRAFNDGYKALKCPALLTASSAPSG